MTSGQTYLEIVESIYDAAADPTLWTGALEKLAAPSEGKAFLTIRDSVMGAQNWPTLYAGMEQDWYSAFLKHYSRRVPWIKSAVPSRPVGKATPSEAVISRSDLLKTEWYNDFMRPQRLISGLGVTVMRDQDTLYSAGILVPEKAEAQQARHLALLQRVTPHFARALKVNRQLQGADFRWHAAEQYFDRLQVGVLLLRTDLTVHFANVEAERILGQQDGLARDREGRLIAASVDDEVRLRRSVRSVASPLAVIADTDGVLRLPRRSGKRAYHVLIAAVRPPTGLFGRIEPTVIAFVSDGRTRQPSHEQLALSFGLTPAESQLLQVLLKGYSLTEAATRLDRSINTAKTHQRGIYDKLECSRLSELVGKVASHPIWMVGRRT